MTFRQSNVYWAGVASLSNQTGPGSKHDARPTEEMRSPVGAGLLAAVGRSRLALAVHADAFRLDPLGYVQAVLWRLRGLRESAPAIALLH